MYLKSIINFSVLVLIGLFPFISISNIGIENYVAKYNCNIVYPGLTISSMNDMSEGDTIAPNFEIIDEITAKCTPYRCFAKTDIPKIINLVDNVDPDPKWWVTCAQGVIEGDKNSNGYVDSTEKWMITEIPPGDFEICYHALDANGNKSTKCTTLHIIDGFPPFSVCEHYLQVSLNEQGNAITEAIGYERGSFDNCQSELYYKVLRTNQMKGFDGGCVNLEVDDNPDTYEVDVWYDDQVYFCCEDINDEVFVTLRVFDKNPGSGPVNPNRMSSGGDLYGHYNTCWTTVKVECYIPPEIDCHPITVNCDATTNPDINDALMPEFSFICGLDLGWSDTVKIVDGLEKIIRTWNASSCSKEVSCVQEITIIPSEEFDPCSIIFPNDSITNCSPNIINKPEWNDNVCTPVGIEIIRQKVFFDNQDNIVKKEIEWAVIDSTIYQPNTGAENNIDSVDGNKLDCSFLVKDGYYRFTQTLIPSFNPCSIVFPENIDDGCKDYSFQKPVWDANYCGNITTQLLVDTLSENDLVLLKQWIIIDKTLYVPNTGAENNKDSIVGNKLDCSQLVEDGYYKYYQTITYGDDHTAPTFSIIDSLVVNANPFDCNLDISIPEIIDIEDNCDIAPKWWVTSDLLTVGGDINENGYVDSSEIWFAIADSIGEYDVCYHAIDADNNESQKCIKVYIIDNSRPTANCERYVESRLTAMGIDVIKASDFNNASIDNCSPVFFKVRRVTKEGEIDYRCDGNGDDNLSTEEYDVWYDDRVFICCEDLEKDVLVSLMVFDKNPGTGPVDPNRIKKGGDLYKHYNECRTSVLVECNVPPFIDCQPVTILCGESYNPDITPRIIPEAIGVCGYTLSYVDQVQNPNNYPDVFIRVWTVEASGLTKSCEQEITVDTNKTFDPCTIEFPYNKTVYCDGTTLQAPKWYSTSCTNVSYEIEYIDTVKVDGDKCKKINIHWIVKDWDVFMPNPDQNNIDSLIGNRLDCSYLVEDGAYRYTQVISVIDTISPYISVEDQCISVSDCYAYNVLLEAFAVDTCDLEKAFDWKYLVVDTDTGDTIQYSYNFFPKPKTGIEGKKSKDDLDDIGTANILMIDPLSIGNYSVSWTVFDDCGNESSKKQFFKVVDNNAPTPVLLDYVALELDSAYLEISAIQFDKGCGNGCISSYDTCTPKNELIFTFTDILPYIREDSTAWNEQILQYGEYYFDREDGTIRTREDYLESKADAYKPELNSARRVVMIDSNPVNVPQGVFVWDQFANNNDCNYNNSGYSEISIVFLKNAVNDLNKTKDFVLYQNRPNPFSRSTEILFKTDKATAYKLTLYNLAGNTIKKYSGISHFGLNTIKINNREIPFSGVLFYKIETAGYVRVKKMIKL